MNSLPHIEALATRFSEFASAMRAGASTLAVHDALPLCAETARGLDELKIGLAATCPWMSLPIVNVCDLHIYLSWLEGQSFEPQNEHLSVSETGRITGIHLDWKTPVVDIEGISFLSELRVLELDQGRVETLGPLAALPRLEELDLCFNRIADLSALSHAHRLSRLEIVGTRVADLTALHGLSNLESLSFADENIADISPLAGCPKLKAVHLYVRTEIPAAYRPVLVRLAERGVDIEVYYPSQSGAPRPFTYDR